MLNNILFTFIVILLIQTLFAIYAISQKTDRVTDLSYGLTFVVTTIILLIYHNNLTPLAYIVTILITLWGVRLSTYLFKRIKKIKKDDRFNNIRGNILKFASFWFFQAISISIIMLPISIIFPKDLNNKLSFISILGITISLTGLIIEYIADKQKFEFKSNPRNKDQFISTGLWKYSRHPNYFGEILFWIGISLTLLSPMQNWEYISLLSPIYIAFLLIFVTGIPTLERKNTEKFTYNPQYWEYLHRTSILIPWWPKK